MSHMHGHHFDKVLVMLMFHLINSLYFFSISLIFASSHSCSDASSFLFLPSLPRDFVKSHTHMGCMDIEASEEIHIYVAITIVN